MKSLLLLLALCALLQACGQKGPLYLPQPDQPAPELSDQENTGAENPDQEAE